MLSFAVHENFNMHIVSGVLRRLPTASNVFGSQLGDTYRATVSRASPSSRSWN